MDCSALQQHVSELEDKLSVAVSENERLQRGVTELEKCKEKLEKESKSLRNSVQKVFQQTIRRLGTCDAVAFDVYLFPGLVQVNTIKYCRSNRRTCVAIF